MTISEASAQIQQLQALLAQATEGRRPTQELIATARRSTALTQALPAKFDPVLQDILDRLESSALFTEESCSFSQRDLLDALGTWLRKAQLALPAANPSA